MGAAALVGKKLGVQSWVVGGTVRDLILSKTPKDVDICVADNLTGYASSLAELLPNARVVAYSRFLTAQIRSAHGRVDLARARSEVYEAPALLPKVFESAIERDLGRRDFTFNAMAISVSDQKLLDPFNGKRDLKNGVLRTLHENSFRDDPTRILRGARYATLVDATPNEDTVSQIAENLKHIKLLRGQRLYREYDLALASSRRAKILETLERWEVNRTVHPSFCVSEKTFVKLADLAATANRTTYWSTLLAGLDDRTAVQVARILNPPKAVAKLFEMLPQVRFRLKRGKPTGAFPKTLVSAVVASMS